MKDIERPKNLKKFYLSWQRLNHMYEDYAKQYGLTYISMFILQLLEDGTTQKELCDTLFFPKQTVNKVIQSFAEKDYLTLEKNPQDKRSRVIRMTEKGRQLQKQVIPTIERAELEAFGTLSSQEQEVITSLWERYTDVCVRELGGKAK